MPTCTAALRSGGMPAANTRSTYARIAGGQSFWAGAAAGAVAFSPTCASALTGRLNPPGSHGVLQS